MNQLTAATFTALLLTTGIAAQAATPMFTLAAGEHRLQDLVDLTAMIGKTEIACDGDALASARRKTIQVQRELRLDGEAFADVASTLLFQAGLIVVDDNRHKHRVVAVTDKQALGNCARKCTPDDVLANPTRVELVSTAVPFADQNELMKGHMLRPFLASRGATMPVDLAVDSKKLEVRLTGASPQVAAALVMLQLMTGEQPAAAKNPNWAQGTHAWTGGDVAIGAFLATFCSTLDANVLGDQLIGTINLGEAAKLSTVEWYEAATRKLYEFGYVLEPLCIEHRVFAVHALDDSPCQLTWRARFENHDDFGKSRAVEPVITIFELQQITSIDAVNALRARGMQTLKCSIGAHDERSLLINGLRPDVERVLELLLQADSQ